MLRTVAIADATVDEHVVAKRGPRSRDGGARLKPSLPRSVDKGAILRHIDRLAVENGPGVVLEIQSPRKAFDVGSCFSNAGTLPSRENTFLSMRKPV
jgi:hypothetical protein